MLSPLDASNLIHEEASAAGQVAMHGLIVRKDPELLSRVSLIIVDDLLPGTITLCQAPAEDVCDSKAVSWPPFLEGSALLDAIWPILS